MIKVLAIAATNGGLGDAVSSRKKHMPNVYTMFFYTDCLIGAIFRTHTKTNASQSVCLLGMDQCVLYMYIYILYSTSRYANMVYEVYTIHIYSRLSHELRKKHIKKNIKKYINNH
jgi:hypothetical protein